MESEELHTSLDVKVLFTGGDTDDMLGILDTTWGSVWGIIILKQGKRYDGN